MYGIFDACTEIRKALTGTNVEYIEMDNLADMMVCEPSRAEVVIDFLHYCERINYLQRDKLLEILNNCEHYD